MKFIPIDTLTLNFSNCSICEANCCDGRKGSTFSQIVLDEFELVSKNFPILFVFGELGFIKPVVLLTNGVGLCSYNQDFKCSIYNERPNACKNYPLSVDIDNKIYIDLACPALDTIAGESMLYHGALQKKFHNESLENYQARFLDTYDMFKEYEQQKEDFEVAFCINGIEFYKYSNKSNNYYMTLHLKSLSHLEKEYYNY